MSVIHDHNLGDVWHRTGGSYNGVLRDVQQLAWLSPAERCRAERLRQAELLFGGRHRAYYVDEGRSQWVYPPLRDGSPPFYSPYNVLGLMTRKIADLLFGEAPSITIDDEATQARLDAIAERSWLTPTLHGGSLEQSWAGETYLEILATQTAAGREAYVSHVPAREVYPVGAPGADRQHAAYVRYATAVVSGEAGKASASVALLLETRYTAGRIERTLHSLDQLDPAGPKRSQKLPLDRWPVKRIDGSPLPGVETTGLAGPSLIRVPNDADGVSDYDGLLELQDNVNAANTQIARVLSKHADPRLIMDEVAGDPTGKVSAAAEVYFKRQGEEPPVYLTWEARLKEAMENRSFALAAVATAGEVPLSLLGIKDDATAESATKMRLNAASAIAKAARKAGYWQPAIRLALALAVEAETGARPAKPIGVALRDGLPTDPVERANEISLLRSASVMSRKRALERQGLESGAIDDELKALDEEAKQNTPSTLLDEPGVAGDRDATTKEPREDDDEVVGPRAA